jgi:hypothetical protein
MITIQDIKDYSKPHDINGGRVTRIGNKDVMFSIVGGVSGLYGDFKDTFEVAIFDNEKHNFITKFFYPEASDDVIGYMKSEDVEKLVNQVLSKGFQVF